MVRQSAFRCSSLGSLDTGIGSGMLVKCPGKITHTHVHAHPRTRTHAPALPARTPARTPTRTHARKHIYIYIVNDGYATAVMVRRTKGHAIRRKRRHSPGMSYLLVSTPAATCARVHGIRARTAWLGCLAGNNVSCGCLVTTKPPRWASKRFFSDIMFSIRIVNPCNPWCGIAREPFIWNLITSPPSLNIPAGLGGRAAGRKGGRAAGREYEGRDVPRSQPKRTAAPYCNGPSRHSCPRCGERTAKVQRSGCWLNNERITRGNVS